MNKESKSRVDKKGNIKIIETALTIAIVFYIMSIIGYNITFETLDKNIAPKVGWSSWLTRHTVFTSASTFFILALRVLILKFRVKWPEEYLSEEKSIYDHISYFLPILDNDNYYNNLHALSRRSRIGYFLIFFGLIAGVVITIRYLITVNDQPELNNYIFNIYMIHSLFIFSLGVLNVYFGIETEIKKRFEVWRISDHDGNLKFDPRNNENKILISVNTRGGWCAINGHEYPIKIKDLRSGKMLVIDKSEDTDDKSKFIYF